MKKSELRQIIQEEIRKVFSEDNINRDIEDAFKKAVGFEAPQGEYGNKVKGTPPGYDELPDTRKDMDRNNSIQLPTIPASDRDTIMFSKKEVDDWISKFKAKYNEQPRFIQTKFGINIGNDAFQEDRKKYVGMKSGELDKYKNID